MNAGRPRSRTLLFDRSLFTGNPREIPLLAHSQIELEVGRPLVAPEGDMAPTPSDLGTKARTNRHGARSPVIRHRRLLLVVLAVAVLMLAIGGWIAQPFKALA